MSPSAHILFMLEITKCKGPFIKDVRKISGILDPLPPLVHFLLLVL